MRQPSPEIDDFDEVDGSLSSFTFPLLGSDTFRQTYTYDELGRLDDFSATGTAGDVADYTYNLASQPTQVDYENGANTTYTYDSFGRVDKVSNIDDSGAVMSSFDYTYNDDGLRTRVDREDGAYVLYAYDNLNRLVKESKNSLKRTALEFTMADQDHVNFYGDQPDSPAWVNSPWKAGLRPVSTSLPIRSPSISIRPSASSFGAASSACR